MINDSIFKLCTQTMAIIRASGSQDLSYLLIILYFLHCSPLSTGAMLTMCIMDECSDLVPIRSISLSKTIAAIFCLACKSEQLEPDRDLPTTTCCLPKVSITFHLALPTPESSFSDNLEFQELTFCSSQYTQGADPRTLSLNVFIQSWLSQLCHPLFEFTIDPFPISSISSPPRFLSFPFPHPPVCHSISLCS